MQKNVSLKILSSEANDEAFIKQLLAEMLAVSINEITGFTIQKRSLDARSSKIYVHLALTVFLNEPIQHDNLNPLHYKDVSRSHKKVLVIGAGPAGLFAALRLIELGIKPIILERGKDVRSRRRDLAKLNKEGSVNPDSNYCFGEGGAGTYSDGKLYTRSTKRGDVKRILSIFLHFGAEENILYEAHPHIGTNKLPQIITAMHKKIKESGGEVHFNKKVVDLVIEKENIQKVITQDGDIIEGDAVILATGHSARDIFELLLKKKLQLEFKPFALGVRVEHPQGIIDAAQYRIAEEAFNKTASRPVHLPPASYNMVHQENGKGVFSFCMCPGGIIAPAATDSNEIVVNGWSPSKRNNPFANSGIVVATDVKDIIGEKILSANEKSSPLIGVNFQRVVEQSAYKAGGGNLVAPGQRLIDFTKNIVSTNLPECSYIPGTHSADLREVLPKFIYKPLQQAFKHFGKKMKGYFTNEAIVVATESRTSSPVRILRDKERLHHPQAKNLFPCGEGAGYAGGIVSAALDGERIANTISITL